MYWKLGGKKDDSCSNELKQTTSWFEPVSKNINRSYTNQHMLLRDNINENTDLICISLMSPANKCEQNM